MKEIPIYGRKNKKCGVIKGYALVDDEDYEKVSQYRWHFANGYCKGYILDGINKQIFMHRLILNAPSKVCVDHVDHDPKNNQKSNLRLDWDKQNHQNSRKRNKNTTSKYKGVSWSKRNKKWRAQIYNDKHISLGLYSIEEDAALAYNEAAKKYFGEYACLNVIETPGNDFFE